MYSGCGKPHCNNHPSELTSHRQVPHDSVLMRCLAVDTNLCVVHECHRLVVQQRCRRFALLGPQRLSVQLHGLAA